MDASRFPRGAAGLLTTLMLAACAGTPAPSTAPPTPAEVQRKLTRSEVCRASKPLGSHVHRRTCRSQREELHERARAGALLEGSLQPAGSPTTAGAAEAGSGRGDGA